MIDGFTGLQRVFLGYAQGWRSKMRDDAMRTQINTDPHSPAAYRVNGVVRNVPEFYEAFEIAATDELYLPPEDRVKILVTIGNGRGDDRPGRYFATDRTN